MAEGGGLLNRYRVVKPYRGFESLRLRQILQQHIENKGYFQITLALTMPVPQRIFATGKLSRLGHRKATEGSPTSRRPLEWIRIFLPCLFKRHAHIGSDRDPLIVEATLEIETPRL